MTTAARTTPPEASRTTPVIVFATGEVEVDWPAGGGVCAAACVAPHMTANMRTEHNRLFNFYAPSESTYTLV
jgi:hypothetical protein